MDTTMGLDNIFQFVSDEIMESDSPFQYSQDTSNLTDISFQQPVPTAHNLSVVSPLSSYPGPSPADNATVKAFPISTAFHPDALWQSLTPDLILICSDSVLFHVHSQLVLQCSENSFGSLIPADFYDAPGSSHLTITPSPSPPGRQKPTSALIHIPETSAVLNIILHAIYGLSCSHYAPSFELLAEAVDKLPSYGVNPKTCIEPQSHLHNLLLSHAPLLPMNVYILAARHDLYELAVSASPHLLSFQLSTLTDEMAKAMGAKYLRRMFFLHIGRADALKRLLLQSPHPHAPTSSCSFADQRNLTRAWALASAYIAWDARPDISKGFLESALTPLADRLTCELCRKNLNDRIRDLVVQWLVVKRTI
ncbi:hypothetical protein EV361DRAFT_484717 [Lentinula raphanica]|uniref:BTB domain-containing protein n=1 Tax=Lentinula raphanica TaxID=153919 RepID=A0AA38PEL8_9AGAR|nr:hypothetical protein F5878DRAFT_11796 [Lentinula raphanica]KAJ3975540.1 hypothetical protein EV361DRAFT_484717 [Lentinula raphanica]